MDPSNQFVKLYSKLEYFIGSTIARVLLGEMGKNCKIHRSVKYWLPSKISIGNDCEIRKGSFIDARSSNNKSVYIGDRTRIKDYVGLAAYGGKIVLGEQVLVGRSSTIFGHGNVTIGDYSMVGPNVTIVSSDHVTNRIDKPFQKQGFTREAINIGDNVWIGANSSVLAGSKIEPNTVIASGAVVKGKLEGGKIYGGSPVEAIQPLDSCATPENKIYKKDWGLFE